MSNIVFNCIFSVDATTADILNLIKWGLDVNAPIRGLMCEEEEEMPIYYFPLQIVRSKEAAQALIDNGADVTLKPIACGEGKSVARISRGTFLHTAKNAGVLSVLLDQDKIDIEAEDPLGETALTRAASLDKVDSVHLLLERGANPNGGLFKCRSVKVMKLLLKFGADLKTKSPYQHETLLQRHFYMLRFYQRSNPCPKTTLKWAAYYQAVLELARYLVYLGVSTEGVDLSLLA